jgi:hypothetical protein
VKVDRYIDLTFALKVALVAVDGILGSYAWTPRPAGAIAGALLGYVVAYILVEILDRLFVVHSDPSRLDRELGEGRREREEERRRRR